jgi:predicted acylesterase/phospholipase RssA
MPTRTDKSILERILKLPGGSLPMPGGGYSGFPPQLQEDSRDNLADDGAKLIFSAIAQGAFLVGGAFLWWFLGGAIRSMLVGVLAGAIVATSLDLLVRAKLEDRRQVLRFGLFWWLKWLGVALLTLFLSGLIGGLLLRIWERLPLIMFLLLYPTFMLIVHRSSDAAQRDRVEWFSVGSALAIAPFLAAWCVASVGWWDPSTAQNSVRAWLDRQHQARAYLSGRINPERCSNWIKDGQPIRVAVTLSGGGYRAALIHAGFLASLDAQCVPVHLLSTVSGGSIVGAIYAMGVPPAQFAWHLAVRQPGLPADVIKILPVARDLITSAGSITDTYADHFRRNYFGNARLAELPDAPLLLINATDLQSGADNAREVFFKNRARSAGVGGKSLDDSVSVAQLVAASGAFPGAFRPATLDWVEAGATEDKVVEVKKRQFVDGGVIDNLGVEGLRHYLTLPRQDKTRPERPHVLIISDASAYGGPEGMSPRADAMTLLKRTTDYTYELLHRHIYARYTGRGDLFQWIRSQSVANQVGSVGYSQIDHRLAENGPKELLSVVIPSTASVMAEIVARYPNCKIDDTESGEAVQKRVARFATLYELSTRQVEEAFWLGQVMGQIYAPAIECARKKAIGEQCNSNGTQAAQAPHCPSRRRLFQ